MKNSRDLILSEFVYIVIIYHISDSWIYLLNGYNFSSDHMTGENQYFTSEIRDCLDLVGTPMALKSCYSYICNDGFNSKWLYEKLAGVVQVSLTPQNLVISRCCFAEDGKEMYKDL